jgi:O-antigen ligase
MENVHLFHTEPGKGRILASSVLLAGLLAMVVLLFGGAGAPLEELSACLISVAALGLIFLVRAPAPNPWARVLGVLPLIALALAAISLLPAAWLGLAPHPYNETLVALGLRASWQALAAAPAQALPNLALLAAYAALMAGLIRSTRHEQLAKHLLQVVALVGGAFAAYGLFVFVGGNQSVLWLPKTAYADSLSGTLISRNHAATLLGLGLLASLGLALLRIGEISRQLPPVQRLKALWLLVLRPGAGWWGVAALQWFALILTNSRAGLGVAMVGVLVLLLSLAWARAAVRWWLVAGLGLLAMVGVLVLSVLGAGVSNRAVNLDRDAAVEGGRGWINLLSIRALENSPHLGHGYGAWEAATAVVRSAEVLKRDVSAPSNAHNLYLQTWVELGWPGLTLLLLFGGLALAILLQGLATRRRQVVFPAVGLAALTLIGLHSAVDFPLHIPGVMLAFLFLVAVGVGQAFKQPEGALPLGWLPRLGGAILAIAVVVAAAWLGWAQWPAWQVAGTVQALKAGESPNSAAMQAARSALQTCVQRAPWHIGCGENLTLLHLTRAGQVGVNSVAGQVMLKAAELQGKKTLAFSPAHPILAYRLARVLALQGKAAEAQKYLTHSVLTGPYEPLLANARAWLLLQELRMGSLGVEDVALYQSNLAGLWQQNPWRLWHDVRDQPAAATLLAQALASQPPLDIAQWEKITRLPWLLAVPLSTPLGNDRAAQ